MVPFKNNPFLSIYNQNPESNPRHLLIECLIYNDLTWLTSSMVSSSWSHLWIQTIKFLSWKHTKGGTKFLPPSASLLVGYIRLYIDKCKWDSNKEISIKYVTNKTKCATLNRISFNVGIVELRLLVDQGFVQLWLTIDWTSIKDLLWMHKVKPFLHKLTFNIWATYYKRFSKYFYIVNKY